MPVVGKRTCTEIKLFLASCQVSIKALYDLCFSLYLKFSNIMCSGP